MSTNKHKEKEKLDFPIMTRINKTTFDQLNAIIGKTKDETLAGLVRTILHNRPVKVYSHDETTDLLLEELAALRSELKAIGVNFNQITRYFNTYSEDAKKRFYAKIGFEKYSLIEGKLDRLLVIVSNLCKKWLSE